MGTKEGTWCNEHWVVYATDESLNSTPETNNPLYIKLNLYLKFLFLFNFLKRFYLFEREREKTPTQGHEQGQRERKKQIPDPGIMT